LSNRFFLKNPRVNPKIRNVKFWHENILCLICSMSHLNLSSSLWKVCELTQLTILLSKRISTQPVCLKSRDCSAIEESWRDKTLDTNLLNIFKDLNSSEHIIKPVRRFQRSFHLVGNTQVLTTYSMLKNDIMWRITNSGKSLSLSSFSLSLSLVESSSHGSIRHSINT
jgi:hypothetical protein